MTRRSINPDDYPDYFNSRKENQMIIKLANVRLAFPDLFQARAFEAGKEPKFGAQLLVPKGSPTDKMIQAAIKEAALAKWANKADMVLKSIEGNAQKYCYTDGDLKDYDGFAGCMALSAKNESKPLVTDENKNELSQADGRPYAGCYVHASVDIWAQDNQWGRGIRAKLRAVRFYRDGDAFAGGAPATENEFDDLAVEDELA